MKQINHIITDILLGIEATLENPTQPMYNTRHAIEAAENIISRMYSAYSEDNNKEDYVAIIESFKKRFETKYGLEW